MRFIHTADWHIGRLFHNLSLLDDQAHVLDQLMDILADTRAEALIVAGDIYDRAVPPADAVRLLDEVIARITRDCRVPVIMIAGNHDSPERLGFGSGLLAEQGFHVRGPLGPDCMPVRLGDTWGEVNFYPIPYAEPAVVRFRLGEGDVHNHDAAMAALVGRIQGKSFTGRNVAIAHSFLTGGETSDSERPLTVGGTGNVSIDRFRGFDYVALGHLHRPQEVSSGVRYSGSLLKYSFSEVGHEKSVTLVEMDAAGCCTTELLPLTPRRDMRIVEGAFETLLQGPGVGESREDYLLVRLSDKKAILDPMGRLRQVYPNVLHLERPGLLESGQLEEMGQQRLRQSERQLFGSFFQQMTGDEPSTEQERVFDEVVDSLHRKEREAVP